MARVDTTDTEALRWRSRVPVHRLFFKIFLWFWLSAVAILAVFAGARMIGLRSFQKSEMISVLAPRLAVEAAQAFESGGAPEFSRFAVTLVKDFERQIYLLDGTGTDVLSRNVPDDARAVAQAARVNGPILMRYRIGQRIASYRFVSPSGRPYVLLFYSHPDLRDSWETLVGQNLPISSGVLLTVTLLCLWLAYHIASPIHSIQVAAKRVAHGDLNARVPQSVCHRHDELAALSTDFNSMVEHLKVLVLTKRELLNSVSHELRSPLARLTVSVALMKKQFPAGSETVMSQMERDMARVETLMSQIITLSRFESGLISGTRECVNLTQLVQEIAADGNFEAQAAGKSVTLQAADSVLLENADPHALRSAFENIVRNAIRFSPAHGAVEMVLEVEPDPGASQVLLSVRDSGPGVPDEDLMNIFQPFFRVGRADSSKDHNGLGLAIAMEAVRLNGGSIAAFNVRPSGLKVEARFPLGRAINVSMRSGTHRGHGFVDATHESG
jgi:two-component system, OmpR family, sensor histidine kinase CpxA